MAVSIREVDCKCLLWYGRSYLACLTQNDNSLGKVCPHAKDSDVKSAEIEAKEDGGLPHGLCISVGPTDDLDELCNRFPWVITEKLVVKPDVLMKRRGKSGLVLLDANWNSVYTYLGSKRGSLYVATAAQGSGQNKELKGPLTHFIVEPYFKHSSDNELYVAMRTLSTGDEILFYEHGGVDVGCIDEKAKRLLIRPDVCAQITQKPQISEGIFSNLVSDVKCPMARKALPAFLLQLYEKFCCMHFAYLEINPLAFDSKTGGFRILDACAKVDHTAEFLCEKEWKGLEFPNPFGRALCPEEIYIRDLDSKTGASLKLTVLNPFGRIWTMIAGGGASVVYSDTVCDLGFAGELCNYGEYSGAPSELTTFEYAKTILSLMTAAGTYREEGKILIIGGGIANFTSVADTFRGIIRALREFQHKLLEFKVRIFVRRGGPSYQDGLKLMRDLGSELGLDMNVYGPETYVTSIIPLALLGRQTKEVDAELLSSSMNGDKFPQDDVSVSNECRNEFNMQRSEYSLNGKSNAQSSSNEPSTNQKSGGDGMVRVSSWHEVTSEAIDNSSGVERCLENIKKQRECPDGMKQPKLEYELFSQKTKCIVWGLQTRAVQEMLDFDHVCGRTTPSVVAIVYEFSVSHLRSFYFGTEEIFIPVCKSLKEAIEKCPDVDVLVNFASMRSAVSVCRQVIDYGGIKTIAVIAEGVPERLSRQLGLKAREKGVCLIGPATVGGMKPGAFRIGNTGGSLENIMNAKLYRPGSVGFVTKSGGMLNELNNILSMVTNGAAEGIAIGGDRFPGTSMIDHLLRFEHNPSIKLLLVLGEVGGDVEYEVVEALKDGRITKPLVAWCVGTCANRFSTEVAFGHAGAWAGSNAEHAEVKNAALRSAGAFVPSSFQTLGTMIKQVYQRLVQQGFVTPKKEMDVPRVPLDYAWAKKLGLVRRPKCFVSTISDDRGEEIVYAGWPISKVLQSDLGVGGVISLLWFKRPLAPYCYRYLETVLMLTADHGPAVCGAHNVIVTSRAGKDLISSLISGLCTIGDRFGGACDQAAVQFLDAYTRREPPEEFVRNMKTQNRLIMGIGHRIKSVHNPDMRVELLKRFCIAEFSQTPLINYALEVEKITTRKKDTLILNVDGLIGVSMCDLLFHCGFFSEAEAKDYVANGCINGLFVLGRSIGFIGHYLDQKRLKQGLYRHDVDDISYVLPNTNKEST